MPQVPEKLTIGIATFDRGRVLLETIRCIREENSPAVSEIIVVDQTPEYEPAISQALAKLDAAGDIRWCCQGEPSLTRARNMILRMAKTEVVLFLDDDVLVPRGVIDNHLKHYADERVGAVAGEVWNCERHDQPSPLDDLGKYATPFLAGKVEPGPCRLWVGCHHSIRRSAAVAAGGYDIQMVGAAYYEDGDMALRVVQAGYQIIFDPTLEVLHLRAPSGGCRIPGTTFPAWMTSVNYLIFRLRYPHERKLNHSCMWGSLRAGPFRRPNVVRFWRQPRAWWDWLKAYRYASRHRRPVNAFDEDIDHP